MEVVLSLGSNDGDRHANVASAIKWLQETLERCRSSSIYETEAIGGGYPYMNAVAKGEWNGTAEELDSLCKEYERRHGRDQKARMLKRVPVDIDIVIVDGIVVRQRDYGFDYFRRGLNELA